MYVQLVHSLWHKVKTGFCVQYEFTLTDGTKPTAKSQACQSNTARTRPQSPVKSSNQEANETSCVGGPSLYRAYTGLFSSLANNCQNKHSSHSDVLVSLAVQDFQCVPQLSFKKKTLLRPLKRTNSRKQITFSSALWC